MTAYHILYLVRTRRNRIFYLVNKEADPAALERVSQPDQQRWRPWSNPDFYQEISTMSGPDYASNSGGMVLAAS
jgi:hypothetical protein